VIARDRRRLADVAKRTGANARPGDATDAALIDAVVAEVRPRVLILNAGATPQMGSIDELSWEAFNAVWNTDVKAGLHGIQAALKTPLPQGGRVILISAGFAMSGAPLGGSSAGAKRMLWWMAEYANARARALGLDLHFQALLPMQSALSTGIGQAVTRWVATRPDLAHDAIISARKETPLPPERWAEHVVTILTAPEYAGGVAFGIAADPGKAGITPLDG
jgi:hypothetical protein